MAMAGLLGSDAHLVTYGAMAKRPVPIPASFHIFKNLTSHGFWLSRWYKDNGERRINLVDELARIMASGKVRSRIALSVGYSVHTFE
jgi:trans-2-enoyl-CoA reductase